MQESRLCHLSLQKRAESLYSNINLQNVFKSMSLVYGNKVTVNVSLLPQMDLITSDAWARNL